MNHELQRCDCELPGDFSSGVPGVLARMEGGRLHPEAVVELCDQCCRFESDAAARSRLVEFGANGRETASDIQCRSCDFSVTVINGRNRHAFAATISRWPA